MPKQIKEFLFDQTTGEINTEYDDNTTEKFNLAAVNQAVSSQAAEIAAVEGRVNKSLKNVNSLDSVVSTALNSTDQLLSQCVLTSSDVKDKSRIDLTLIASKTGGTSDTATFRIRIGKTGTTSDPIVVSAGLSTTLVTWAYKTSVQIFSDGFMQIGLNTAVVPMPGASAAALASKQTISGMLEGNVFVSVYCQMASGTTERGQLSVFEVDARY